MVVGNLCVAASSHARIDLCSLATTQSYHRAVRVLHCHAYHHRHCHDDARAHAADGASESLHTMNGGRHAYQPKIACEWARFAVTIGSMENECSRSASVSCLFRFHKYELSDMVGSVPVHEDNVPIEQVQVHTPVITGELTS